MTREPPGRGDSGAMGSNRSPGLDPGVAQSSFSDQQLAQQTQAGSMPAFEELVSRYENRIFSFVARCCGNTADAREITQDSFVQAFHAIARFDPRQEFAPWLFTIARRKCIDHHRASPPSAEENIADLPDVVDPSELLAREEERQDLWNMARRRLSQSGFHALWLKYVEDLNVTEIAQVLGLTQTHVKVLLFRARNALARALKPGADQNGARSALANHPVSHAVAAGGAVSQLAK
jgi:RNA polymerase sigma-70 factor (ECF subfamily)